MVQKSILYKDINFTDIMNNIHHIISCAMHSPVSPPCMSKTGSEPAGYEELVAGTDADWAGGNHGQKPPVFRRQKDCRRRFQLGTSKPGAK